MKSKILSFLLDNFKSIFSFITAMGAFIIKNIPKFEIMLQKNISLTLSIIDILLFIAFIFSLLYFHASKKYKISQKQNKELSEKLIQYETEIKSKINYPRSFVFMPQYGIHFDKDTNQIRCSSCHGYMYPTTDHYSVIKYNGMQPYKSPGEIYSFLLCSLCKNKHFLKNKKNQLLDANIEYEKIIKSTS